VLFLLLGIVSIYIGLIYEEVKGRPNFIIRQRRGFGGLVTQLASSNSVSTSESRDGVPVQSSNYVTFENGASEQPRPVVGADNGRSPTTAP
jgi:hypothetical protein